MPELAVISLSGGMDSCVTAAIAKAEGYELALLHADYGQRTQAREKQAYREIADFYGVPASRRLIIGFDTLKAIGGSALTDAAIALPEGDLAREGVPVSYVPFRNAHLLATCVIKYGTPYKVPPKVDEAAEGSRLQREMDELEQWAEGITHA